MGAQRFITIDFETANLYLSSACSVGIAVVDGLEIVDTFDSFIKPPIMFFEESNIEVHGITPGKVENAPTLDELWCMISQYFSEHVPVVAHNAHFDMSVLRLSTSADIPNFPYVDSMGIAAPFVGGRKSLRDCAEALEISMEHHHNACSDAVTAAEIVIACLKAADCISLWEFLAKNQCAPIYAFADLVPQERFQSRKKAGKRRPVCPKDVRPSEICQTVSCVDCKNPLYGKAIVFTGELSIDRRTAMQMAVDSGAVVKSSVSKKTNYLVVGQQDKQLVGEDGLSTKEEKAYALNRSGAGHVQIINEEEFMKLVAEVNV